MTTELDMADICNSPKVVRAAEICAAGNHSLFLVGKPGTGRTMLARRLTGILPDMTQAEYDELNRIRALAKLPEHEHLERPFRAPHYTVSKLGLWGKADRPGEIALANHGVLFLDETTEFRQHTIQDLHAALYARTLPTITTTLFVAAIHPCRCGWGPYDNKCKCPKEAQRRYAELVEVIAMAYDIKLEMPLVRLSQAKVGESSAAIRERVTAVRKVQASRGDSEKTRISRVARTIADMAGSPTIEQVHLDEAKALTGYGTDTYGY